MTDLKPSSQQPDDSVNATWIHLRSFTAARIGLARSGASLATAPLLEFRLAHARARDAVHAPFDDARLCADLEPLGLSVLTVASMVHDRTEYLMRPDLGRQLDENVKDALGDHKDAGHDLALVVTDGLSARAVERHAPPLLAELVPLLKTAGWRLAPLTVVRHGRVAIGDQVAELLRARMVAVLIGERPGLSAPDSMGAYPTWQPSPRTTDADRNCISNIRPEGIDPKEAAFKLMQLLSAMRKRKTSGVALKDESEQLLIEGRNT